MVNMYEIVAELCRREGISVAKMCGELQIRPSVISELKHGRTKSLSSANIARISEYFHVSADVFRDGFTNSSPDSSPRASDEDIMFALFGGDGEITDEMYEEVKQFALFVKNREAAKKKKE